MTLDLVFQVPGQPVPWRRARRAGRRTYTDPKDRAYRRTVAMLGRAALPRGWPLDARYGLSVDAHFGDARRRDADNVAKAVMDALSGVAWADDSQITVLQVRMHERSADPQMDVQAWVVEK